MSTTTMAVGQNGVLGDAPFGLLLTTPYTL